MDTEKLRQSRRNDTRLTERRKCQKWAATHYSYRIANQQRMAARRALEWIRTSQAWLVFRYEISYLFSLLHSFSCIQDMPPFCVLLSNSVCSSPTVCAPQSWWGSTHGEPPLTIPLMIFMNTQKPAIGCQRWSLARFHAVCTRPYTAL